MELVFNFWWVCMCICKVAYDYRELVFQKERKREEKEAYRVKFVNSFRECGLR